MPDAGAPDPVSAAAVSGARRPRPRPLRARLVGLVVACLVPALAIAIVALILEYQRQRDGFVQTLRETTRALALVVDREIGKREAVARTLAELPAIDARDFGAFHAFASRATSGFQGWVVLSDARGQLANTALGFGRPLSRRADGEPARFRYAIDAPVLTGLTRGRLLETPVASLQVPVIRDGRTLYNVGVTIRPEELQQVLLDQQGPRGWIGTILDERGQVVARTRDPERWVGRLATPEVLAAMKARPEGIVESRSLDGVPATAFYSRSPVYGWTFVIGVPEPAFPRVGGPLAAFAAIGAVLLALSIALALKLARGIAAPIAGLRDAALRLQRGAVVDVRPSGITECDEVGEALAAASRRMVDANAELSRQVERAIATTEQVQAQLASAQRMEALGRLTGGVAHDFNNLLAVVNNNLFLLQRAGADPSTAPASLAAIQRSVDTGVRLTRQLLAFSRRQPLSPEVIDLREYLPGLSDLLVSCIGKSIELCIDAGHDVACIEVDPGELELAIINLAMNAKDAMKGGGRLRIEARNATAAEAPRGGACVRIALHDSGTGIAPHVLDKVFEPFFTTKPAGHGTGLGLSQVHGFCAQSGGVATVQSEVGSGTTVAMLLPAAGEARRRRAPAEHAPLRAYAGRVLLVEDNVDLLSATVPVLASFGFDVVPVANADQALQLIASGRTTIDVVLSDVNMPGTRNGLDLARWLASERPALPIVLMTGYTEQYERAIADGLRVLHKPCDPVALVAALQAARDAVAAAPRA